MHVESDEKVLIEQACAGRTDSFAALVDRHTVPVRRRILSILRNPADTDDVIQEVMLKVWRHLPSFRGDSSFRSWMISIAIHESLIHCRKRRVKPALCVSAIDVPAPREYSPDRTALRNETVRCVRHAAATLPKRYREVIFLREFDERNCRETAESLGLTEAAVRTRLSRARAMLSVRLRPALS